MSGRATPVLLKVRFASQDYLCEDILIMKSLNARENKAATNAHRFDRLQKSSAARKYNSQKTPTLKQIHVQLPQEFKGVLFPNHASINQMSLGRVLSLICPPETPPNGRARTCQNAKAPTGIAIEVEPTLVGTFARESQAEPMSFVTDNFYQTSINNPSHFIVFQTSSVLRRLFTLKEPHITCASKVEDVKGMVSEHLTCDDHMGDLYDFRYMPENFMIHTSTSAEQRCLLILTSLCLHISKMTKHVLYFHTHTASKGPHDATYQHQYKFIQDEIGKMAYLYQPDHNLHPLLIVQHILMYTTNLYAKTEAYDKRTRAAVILLVENLHELEKACTLLNNKK